MNRICFTVLILTGCIMSACAWIDEIGKDKSYATIELTSSEADLNDDMQCVVDKLPIEFWDFDADEPFDGIARLHFYESLSNTMRGDYMEIRFVEYNAETQEKCPDVEEYIGETFDITRNGCVQATLQINSCVPRMTVAFLGTMTLIDYDTARRTWVSGNFSGQLVYYNKVTASTEVQETGTVLADTEGKFAFVNHVGAIWER